MDELNVTGNGTLYLVPTPIGNLEDITLRGLRILRETEVVACEDTRVTARLLNHFELPHKKLISYFAGNERRRAEQIVEILKSGQDVALVSDAGTPGLSDPGFVLINSAIEAGIPIVSLPGATAAITALVASGLPTHSVLFDGFLPHKKGRQTRLKFLASEPRTVILYESPHRLLKTLRELAEHCGPERHAVIGRELTKVYEEYNRGTLAELLEEYSERAAVKGEFVLLIAGKE